MELKGYTKGEYFHIDCLMCGKDVDVTRVWFDGVPHIDVECRECAEKDQFKLTAGRWGGLVKLLMK